MKTQTTMQEVSLSDILISKTNPRTEFDEEAIKELAASIKEKGLLQPVVLRNLDKKGKYELVCGERRVRACKLINAEKIPAVIRVLTDEEALELQIIENLQRKDVHPMDEAIAFHNLIKTKKMDLQEVAKRVGKSIAYVAQRLKLNDLAPAVQKVLYEGRLKLTTAMKLAVFAAADQEEILSGTEYEQYPKDEIEIDEWDLNRARADLSKAPFDTADPLLIKKMGACGSCQYNTASNSLLFPEQAEKAHCLNSSCFKQKCDLGFSKNLKDALEDPSIILLARSHRKSKEAKDLEVQGHHVYSGREIKLFHSVPDAPDREDYETDKEYDREVKAYNKEMKEYEDAIATGKYKKAFVVDGHNRGSFEYVELDENKPAGADTSKAVADKMKAGTVSADDIQAEISRIREREERAAELDEYKAMDLFHLQLENDKQEYIKGKSALQPVEWKALVVLLYELVGWSVRDEFHDLVGMEESDDAALVRFMESNPPELLLKKLARVAFSEHLKTAKRTREQSNKAAILAMMIETLHPSVYSELQDGISEGAKERKKKVEKRIAELTEKLNELQPKKKKKK